MEDASASVQHYDLEARVGESMLSKGTGRVKEGAKFLYSLARDPYSVSQYAANGVERLMRFYVVHNFVTGDDNTFLMNMGEMALLTAISAGFHETFTTPVHRWLFRRKKGSAQGFVQGRVKVEAQHYRIRGILTPMSWTASAAAESFLGIPREITTQAAGMPFGLLQGGYSTQVRRRVDAGLPLDTALDKAVRAPYRPLESAWKLLKGPELVGLTKDTGRIAYRATAAAFTHTTPAP